MFTAVCRRNQFLKYGKNKSAGLHHIGNLCNIIAKLCNLSTFSTTSIYIFRFHYQNTPSTQHFHQAWDKHLPVKVGQKDFNLWDFIYCCFKCNNTSIFFCDYEFGQNFILMYFQELDFFLTSWKTKNPTCFLGGVFKQILKLFRKTTAAMFSCGCAARLVISIFKTYNTESKIDTEGQRWQLESETWLQVLELKALTSSGS